MQGLLAVELDDELLVDGQVDVGAGGQGQYLARKVLAVDVQPLHGTLAAGKVARLFEHNQLFRAFADRDLVANLALEGRDVDLAAVYLDVAVANQLARLTARHGVASVK